MSNDPPETPPTADAPPGLSRSNPFQPKPATAYIERHGKTAGHPPVHVEGGVVWVCASDVNRELVGVPVSAALHALMQPGVVAEDQEHHLAEALIWAGCEINAAYTRRDGGPIDPEAPADPLVALGAEELASRLRDLQQRVVQNSDTGRAPRPLWVHVMVATGLGSTSAHQLCRDAGEDPDAVWGEATLAHLTADRLPPDLLSSLLHQLDEGVLQDALHKLDADDYDSVLGWARAAWTERVAEDAQLNVDEVPPPPPALTRLRDEHTDYWAAYSRSLDEDGEPPELFTGPDDRPVTAAELQAAAEVSDA